MAATISGFTFLISCFVRPIFAQYNPVGCLNPFPGSTGGLPLQLVSALAFERTTWGSGTSVCSDPFYKTDARHADAKPGTLLKVEETDPARYTIPPGTGISRVVYQSKNSNGTATPASAYILFPHSPRYLADGSIPVVVWAHGTSAVSGHHPNCAPSHHRDLWQHYMAPIPLALHGYVVVAPDYAGLGVGLNAKGEPILHEWLVGDAQVNDMIYGLQAAREAYPILGRKFVAVGHSQGGGAAWSFAERMHTQPMDGFQGTVAISPTTRFLEQATDDNIAGLLIAASILRSVANVFPQFDVRTVLTAKGQLHMQLDDLAQGCTAVSSYLFGQTGLLKAGWRDNEYVQRFQNLTAVGGKPLARPMLVIHGDEDIVLLINNTDDAIDSTADANPDVSLEYHRYAGGNHGSALWASQRSWLNWIADRFDGKPTASGLDVKNIAPLLPKLRYQERMTWYPEFASQFYHTP